VSARQRWQSGALALPPSLAYAVATAAHRRRTSSGHVVHLESSVRVRQPRRRRRWGKWGGYQQGELSGRAAAGQVGPVGGPSCAAGCSVLLRVCARAAALLSTASRAGGTAQRLLQCGAGLEHLDL
jgi:hypothetical protein